jgi:hypothetical protein
MEAEKKLKKGSSSDEGSKSSNRVRGYYAGCFSDHSQACGLCLPDRSRDAGAAGMA